MVLTNLKLIWNQREILA
uniref:Uncharacterized protein n=1 Tax=Arundo donax TaxID=35708 RepID=A0A0A9BSY8_ARUDO